MPADALPWPAEKARTWYASRPWLCGFNYVPSSAINSTEMWQRESFDLPTIRREMDWAQALGLNTCRVFIQYLVWEADPEELLTRLDQFLAVAAQRGITTLPILFDDCAFANKQPYLGRQDAPTPGIHNGGWTPSPGHARVLDRAAWPALQAYVTQILSHFADDPRILAWDLYNEPGNGSLESVSLALLEEAFLWARAARPQQPLTAGIWNPALTALNTVSVAKSDIVTFHNYNAAANLVAQIAQLKTLGRPVLCTEWMHRQAGRPFLTHLEIFRRAQVGCYFWGLVNGKTQTHYPWGSVEGADEPEVWFHDLLTREGQPYSAEETEALKRAISLAHR